jgi:hypothetical protein
VRADQGDAPLELVEAAALELLEQPFGELPPVGEVTDLEARLVLEAGVVTARPAGDGGVGVADVRSELGDQAQPLGQDLGAGACEVGVPYAERRERTLP